MPGLDEILGGGLPEYSFNIIAGAPGGGKTTLAHQIVFANATPERPALYFTVLGEPAIKMLRYQQQFTFFDPAKLNAADPVRQPQPGRAGEGPRTRSWRRSSRRSRRPTPGIVVVDSFRTVVRKAAGGTGEVELQGFVQRLALHLTSWQATTFLIGEYAEGEIRDNPVFTVADGLFWLYQQVERNSIVRKLQVMKLRGQASVPGLHTFRITADGLQAFPRTFGLTGRSGDRSRAGGGSPPASPNWTRCWAAASPRATACWWPGRPGSGKSVLAHPVHRRGPPPRASRGSSPSSRSCPEEYVAAGRQARHGLRDAPAGRQAQDHLPPAARPVGRRDGARDPRRGEARSARKRVVIDSLAGFEMALAPGFRPTSASRSTG